MTNSSWNPWIGAASPASGPPISTETTQWTTIEDLRVNHDRDGLFGAMPVHEEGLVTVTVTAEARVSRPGRRMFLRVLIDGDVAEPANVVFTSGQHFNVHSFTFVAAAGQDVTRGIRQIEAQWCVDDETQGFLGDRSFRVTTLPHNDTESAFHARVMGGHSQITSTDPMSPPGSSVRFRTERETNLSVSVSAETAVEGTSGLMLAVLVDGAAAEPANVVFSATSRAGCNSFVFTWPSLPTGQHDVELRWYMQSSGSTGHLGDSTVEVLAAPSASRRGGHAVQASPDGTPINPTSVRGFTDLPEMRTSVATPASGTAVITFSAEMRSPADGVWVRALLDGEPTSPSDVLASTEDTWGVRSFVFAKKGLSAGVHEVRLQWAPTQASTEIGDRTISVTASRPQVPDVFESFHRVPPVNKTLDVLAILWDPQRAAHPAPTIATLRDMLFDTTGPSVRTYFEEASDGRFSVREADIIGPVPAAFPANHYWGSHPAHGSWSSGHTEKWAEALDAAVAAGFNFGQYDRDGDNRLTPDDLVVVIVIPQTNDRGFRRPPLAQQLPTPQPYRVGPLTITQIHEAYVNTRTDAHVGLLAHEIAHGVFEASDTYFSTGGYQTPMVPGGAPQPFVNPFEPVRYSLMGEHRDLSHFDPLHALRFGWLLPTLVSHDGTYVLTPVEDDHEVLVICDPMRGTDEFFIVEHRAAVGAYDQGLPAHGIAVWHVIDYPAHQSVGPPPGVDAFQWTDLGPNDWARRGLRLLRPPGGWVWDGTTPGPLNLVWANNQPAGISLGGFTTTGTTAQVAITGVD